MEGDVKEADSVGVLSGFACTYHPAALGSSPKHTIYALIIYGQICA